MAVKDGFKVDIVHNILTNKFIKQVIKRIYCKIGQQNLDYRR